jgi:PKD repeat protein
MKYILSIILIITIGLNLYSQNLRNPVDNSGNGLSNLYSDWGPRNFTGGSRFHAGLDYSPLPNGVAYALVGGTPLTFTLNGTASYITVGNWVYMHVLIDSTGNNNWTLKNPVCGNRVLLETLGANGQTKIFVNSNEIEFLGVVRISKWGTPATTTRTAEANDIVFRPNELNHLHLQTTINGNWVNPLTYIAYNGSNSNNMTLDLRMKYNNVGVAIEDFPHTNTTNVVYGEQVIVESDVNYIGEYDLNVTQVEVQPTDGAYALIPNARWVYSGDGHMTFTDRYGGIGSSPYYNSYPQRTDTQTRPEDMILNDPREGVHPVRTGAATNQLGRDIFKRHWNTMQGWNTNTPAFPDGEYTLRLTTQDIRGNVCQNPATLTRIIDNFRPYIKKVEVRKGSVNGELVYCGEWQWNSGNLQATISGNGCITTDLVWVHVYPSESMSNVEIKVNGTSCNSLSSSSDSHWVFKINAGVLSTNNSITINENSSDLAGNKLYGFLDGNNLVSGNSIPKRTNSGTWSSSISQNDTFHEFGASHPPVDLVANFTASTQSASSGASIQFYNASSGDPTNFNWYFPGGSPSSSTLQNPVVTYDNVGTYDVTLSVSGNGQSDTETKTNFISIEMNEFEISGSVVEFYGNHSAIQGVSVEFIPNSASTGNESGIVITDYNGEFNFSVSDGWQGNIYLTKAGYGNELRSVGIVNDNYSLGEIAMQFVALDFSYEYDSDQCINIDIQTNVPFSYATFNWIEPISGNYSNNFSSKRGQICFNDFQSGDHCSVDVGLCLFDTNNEQIGSCIEKNVSFYFEPINTECFYTDITASYQIEQSGNVFPIGTAVRFNNTSYPQGCIMTSVWWFDNENTLDDCSWWDVNFVCDATCKYDKLQEHNCMGLTNGAPYYADNTYNQKGIKEIRLFVSSGCNAREVALGCDDQHEHLRDDEVLGKVIIVDCDEIISYSNNLSNAVENIIGNTKQYYSGEFVLNGQITYPSNINKQEFIACNSVRITNGFKLNSSNKAFKMYVHSNLESGNVSSNKSKAIIGYEQVELNYEIDDKLTDLIFDIYPNPTCEILNIELLGVAMQDVLKMEICDFTGRKLRIIDQVNMSKQIDVSEFRQGAYIITLYLTDKKLSRKFIKE